MLRTATGAAVGLGFVSTASANNGQGNGPNNGRGPGRPDQYEEKNGIKYRFFGCSQVCVNERVTKVALVDSDGKCAAPPIYEDGGLSNRGNLWDDDDIWCLSTDDVDAEAIVGIYVYDGDWGDFITFIPNPNRCAENYPDCDTYREEPVREF